MTDKETREQIIKRASQRGQDLLRVLNQEATELFSDPNEIMNFINVAFIEGLAIFMASSELFGHDLFVDNVKQLSGTIQQYKELIAKRKK